ncbi:Amidohydrolase family protein [Paracidovorax anthurii]|uniref:Amidohydrolase family protein n=1 Tax=Paracidovorax anthurii TaxID=78229 RepID=A0A328YME2_9BURK|nr:amidohydrolase family protein [Paracidovorax anthurii]
MPHVTQPFKVLADNPDLDYRRAIVRFAECRNLLGGTTTGQGLSLSSPAGIGTYFKGLMRNVEQPVDPAFPVCSGQTLDFKPEEIESRLVPALQTGRPYFYHLSEGTDEAARQRFLDLRRAGGAWAVAKTLVCIHCVGLQAADFDVLRESAGMVWSPTSNLLLYGQTADIAAARARGVPIALGADWAPSGCKNLLGELKVARAVSAHQGGVLSARELVEAVTSTAAKMIGWDAQVGTIAPGRRADLLILEGTSGDPYTHLIDAQESSILAVLIDGRARLAAGSFALGDPRSSEAITVGGRPFVLDLVEPADDGLGGMQLSTAIAKLSYGLANLPSLAAGLQPAFGVLSTSPDEVAYRLVAEMEDEDAAQDAPGLFAAAAAAAAPETVALQLDPITAVDDAGFARKMRASVNLPDYVKAVF